MTRDETVALFLECEAKRAATQAQGLSEGKSEILAVAHSYEAAQAHWNAWAESLLAERKAMEADGRWAAEKGRCGKLEPQNEETRAWMTKAAADLSRCRFLTPGADGAKAEQESSRPFPPVRSIELEGWCIYFHGFIFPGDTSFNGAAFSGGADFWAATFSGTADFAGASFSSGVKFGNARFSGTADFSGATFSGEADFGATFSDTANFIGAAFSGDVRFGGAYFYGKANFVFAAFSGRADLGSLFFSYAEFTGVTFQSSTSFAWARFKDEARFMRIRADRAFDMRDAEFAYVPWFDQADFKQAPNLDGVSFPIPSFWHAGPALHITSYRALRRMANQSADFERAQMALKGETRSKRGTGHKPWHAAFWFGIAYDALSDFGRSIARPLAIWLGSAIAFAAIYFWNAGARLSEWLSPCDGDGISKALKAITLSAANALPLIGSSRSEEAKTFYTCLGLQHAPAWSPILQIGQTLWSAALLFLFLLALRNQFKIK